MHKTIEISCKIAMHNYENDPSKKVSSHYGEAVVLPTHCVNLQILQNAFTKLTCKAIRRSCKNFLGVKLSCRFALNMYKNWRQVHDRHFLRVKKHSEAT